MRACACTDTAFGQVKQVLLHGYVIYASNAPHLAPICQTGLPSLTPSQSTPSTMYPEQGTAKEWRTDKRVAQRQKSGAQTNEWRKDKYEVIRSHMDQVKQQAMLSSCSQNHATMQEQYCVCSTVHCKSSQCLASRGQTSGVKSIKLGNMPYVHMAE
jgi:hypothetical protein